MMRISVLAHKSRGEDQKEKGLRGEILDFVLVFTRVFRLGTRIYSRLGAVAYAGFSKGGGGAGNLENLRTTKTRIKIFPPVRFPAQNQVKTKKKGLHSDLLRFLAQNWVKAKKRSSPTVCVLKPSAQVTNGGGGLAAILHPISC